MQKVKLNIVPKGVKRETYLSQNDNGRVVRYELFNELVPYTLDGSETITVKVVRPDGVEIVSSVPNTEEAYIDVTFNDDMSAIAGVGAGEIKITDGETVLGSHNFDINVEIDAYNGKDVIIETSTGTLAEFDTEVEDNALEYESEIPYNAEGYTGLRVINTRTAPAYDKTPYLFRKTPSGYGNSCIEKINGLSVAFNQLAYNGNFETVSGWAGRQSSISVNNNIATITPSSNGYQRGLTASIYTDCYASHKYLLSVDCLSPVDSFVELSFSGRGEKKIRINASTWKKCAVIYTPPTDLIGQSAFYALISAELTTSQSIQYKNAQSFDLTQMFGSTIADYIYSLETAQAGAGVSLFKSLGFDKPYYEYNAGSLKSSIPVAKRIVFKNLFDEDTILQNYNFTKESDGSFYSNIFYSILNKSLWENNIGYDGTIYLDYDYKYQNSTGSAGIRFSIEYEDGYISGSSPDLVTTFTHFQRVSLSGHGKVKRIFFDYGTSNNATWLKNVSVTLESGSYEPYKETIINLGGDELRGLLKLDSNNNIYADGDTKTSDGKIKRKLKSIIFDGSSDENWSDYNSTYNGFAVRVEDINLDADNPSDQIISNIAVVNTIRGSSMSMSGLTIKTYSSTSDNKYFFLCGSGETSQSSFLNWLSSHNLEVVVNAASDTIEESSPFDNPQEIGTTEEIIDGNVYDKVDLGSLEWTYNASIVGFLSNVTFKGSGSNSIAANMLCEKYVTVSWDNKADKTVFLSSTGALLGIKDSNYGTDAAAFKASLDGVYLYYEKSDSDGVEIPLGHDTIYGTDIEYIDIDFDTTIYGGNINAKDGKLSSEYNSDGSVKPTPEIIDITPALIPVRAGDNKIFNSADGEQTIRYYNQVE